MLASLLHVPSATFLGAIIRTRCTAQRLYRSSFMAVRVMTVLSTEAHI